MPDDILTPVPGVPNLTYEDANILLSFQKLWIELVLWMRTFFHSTLENMPDMAAITSRVFQQLPSDFYNKFSKYFGPEVSQQFLNIFSRLVTINWQFLYEYIQLKIREIIAFLSGDYEQEIVIFNEIADKVTRMSAYLAMGIIARKPQRPQPQKISA